MTRFSFWRVYGVLLTLGVVTTLVVSACGVFLWRDVCGTGVCR